jgi:hypothetical protein
MSGCGVGTVAAPQIPIASIHGRVHGGPNPIQSGNVILWQTQTGATSTYGSAALQLATATTDEAGSFQFTNTGAGAYTCTIGEFAYITVTGGLTGANTPNPNSIQMAAIGPCIDLGNLSDQDNTEIFLSELSTAAAAYALGRFISINPNTSAGPGMQLVNVGAPLNNNAVTPACTGSGPTLSCTAAGLGHAFANAANLVDAAEFDGVLPSGLAYTVPPSNTQASVPQALLNTLADIQQACVNTSGGVSGDNSACGNLFKDTKPTSGAAPTDTLHAMINIAQNPATQVAALFLLSAPRSFFTPALTSAPTDFSLAIAYTGTTYEGIPSSFVYPYSLTLDYSDNVYILLADKSTPTYTALAGVTANGTSLFSSAQSRTYIKPVALATDTLGNVWSTNNGTKRGTFALLQYIATTGLLQTAYFVTPAPYALAIDRSNNLWYTSAITGQQDLFELSQAASYFPVTFTSPPAQTVGDPYAIAIDAAQNVWFVDNTPSGTTGLAGVFPNTGTAAAPAYANAAVTASLPGTEYAAVGIAIDGSGNAWTASHTKFSKFVPAATSGVVTSIATPKNVTASPSVPLSIEVDGQGTIWATAASGTGSIDYSAAGGAEIKLAPCYAPAAAQSCAALSLDNRSLQIDSTGSIWVAASGSGYVLQLIGTAAPTWPQLSLGAPGVEPQ